MSEFKDPLPLEVVFVRHGRSEANELQAAEKADEAARRQATEEGRIFDESQARARAFPEALRLRPDWEHRLSPTGVEQAKTTGRWITENIGDIGTHFDVRYTSPFVRTRETALHLGGVAVGWRTNRMLYERDWGQFGVTPRTEQAKRFPFETDMKKRAPLFARLAGGEAIAETVTLRVQDFRNTLRERWSDKSALVVSHGDIIGGAVRYVFEHMTPEEWQEMSKDDAQDIANCALLWYSRVNPDDPHDIRPYIKWRRMVDPNDLDASPFGGEWCEIPYQSERSGEEMLADIEKFPRLLS